MTRAEEIASRIRETRARIAQLEQERAALQQQHEGGRSVDFSGNSDALHGARETLGIYEQELAKEAKRA